MKIRPKPTCCCDSDSERRDYTPPRYIIATLATAIGQIPCISTRLTWRDKIDAIKVRWGIKRMNYRVQPGLYGVGKPDENAPVLVTANYKLTFDALRSQLNGLDLWILVLDTMGINVWCAAGKGTFGTKELVRRVRLTHLANLIAHKKLILPQLGAPGVAAHEVQKMTGFRVVYGPIYAKDVPQFLQQGMKASDAMRRVQFTFQDRLVLVPMEIVPALKYAPLFIIWIVLDYYLSSSRFPSALIQNSAIFLLTFLSGTVFFQLLLPWIPIRSFAAGGWALASFSVFILSFYFHNTILQTILYLLLFPPLAAFLAVNFTGSTPFTSLSGVKKELAVAMPLIIGAIAIGVVLQVTKWIL